MPTFNLIYATNRNALGDPNSPSGYGTTLTTINGGQDLRFGVVSVDVPAAVAKLKSGQDMSTKIAALVDKAVIKPYDETIAHDATVPAQAEVKLGSQAMFWDAHTRMCNSTDVVLYVHGFNMSWADAVADALALQVMLSRSSMKKPDEAVMVVLFSWPSDGMSIPFLSYLSDRADARTSGLAMGRAFLKFRDFLTTLRIEVAKNQNITLCQQEIHVLCHSMGNYLLQKALEQLKTYTPGTVLPRIFDQVFLCAPDVDDTVLEDGQPLALLSQVAKEVTLYHNPHDKALMVSDTTKGNPDRLGTHGAAHPAAVHIKIQQVDCAAVAAGFTQHSYFLDVPVVDDIRQSVDGVAADDTTRLRVRAGMLNNVWRMRGI